MEYIINEDCLDSATITHADATGNLCELVRCKDCKHGTQCDPPDDDRYCVLYDQFHDMDWFCADGKVKQDG